MIAEAMPCGNGVPDDVLDCRKEVLSDLRSLAVGLDDFLEKTIMQGVAFHRKSLYPIAVLHVLTFSRCWLDHRGT